ncbi:MAG: glycosyl hydrolase [Chloroflexi bacterium]|nr:glycosyl hydrolase [Chloroflexota bacterium]
MTDSKFAGLTEFRCIGPFRGGRVVAVAGDPRDTNTFYFGGVCGGVWKSTDAGQYWENISDGFFTSSSVGALEVAPADPNVIYAGTGETTIRIDVSIGDGIYKSTDAGRSWKHLGLKDTRQIAKIRTHPDNADLVYAAVFGHAFGPNPERGVYRSKDGGETWENILHVSDKAGAIDLTIDKNNPRVIYAAFWEAYRNFWNISSGGEDSGIWRSMDGGDTWQCLTGVEGLSNPPPDSSGGPRGVGLPEGLLGKIGLAASPAQPGRVWAIIENQPDGGIYRSDDYGETWLVGSKDNRFISRAWYYMHLTADPLDANTIYINNLNFWKSTDGGHNFTEITTPHGDDHDLWIHPGNNKIMIHGNDGGACVSLNGGLSWSSIYNQPTAQFYHLDTDSNEPYFVYGTQQDNSSLRVPSRSRYSSITWEDCDIIGSGESGYIAVDPADSNVVYVGAIGSSPGGGNSLQRYDHRIQQIRLIATWPRSSTGLGAGADKYRFAWTYPIVFSPHDSNTLYIGGNQILKTTDEGQSWEEISPDLTKADPETLGPSGGPINRDAVGAEHYATVYTLAESPHEPGVIWAGSDDGLLHITRDAGESWTEITPVLPPSVPPYQRGEASSNGDNSNNATLPFPDDSGNIPREAGDRGGTGPGDGVDFRGSAMFTIIEPSPHDPATAYVTATRYKNDDYAPYVFKSTDYGASWTLIVEGIEDDHFCRVVREDPARQGLLYLGTEFGLYISFDAGESWQRFQLNLPISPIYDLKIKGDDLIVATHGRSFWILDDLTVLRQLVGDPMARPYSSEEGEVRLLKPGTVERRLPKVFEGLFESGEGKQYMSTLGMVAAYVKEKTPEHGVKHTYLDSGTNPPKGAVITYFLREQPEATITLRINDADGNEVKTFKSLHADEEDKAKLPFPDASGNIPREAGDRGGAGPGDGVEKELRNPAKAGWNRFIWDLRYPDAHKVVPHDDHQQGFIKGPHAVPGTYRVTLTVGDEALSEEFEIVKEAGVEASQADLQAQFALLLKIRDKVSATHKSINQMRDLRAQLRGWRDRLAGLEAASGIIDAAKALEEQVLEVEKALMIPETRAGWPDAMNHGDRLATQLSNLSFNVNLGDYQPTDYEHEAFAEIADDIDGAVDKFNHIVDGDMAEFNTMLGNAGFGKVVLKVE